MFVPPPLSACCACVRVARLPTAGAEPDGARERRDAADPAQRRAEPLDAYQHRPRPRPDGGALQARLRLVRRPVRVEAPDFLLAFMRARLRVRVCVRPQATFLKPLHVKLLAVFPFCVLRYWRSPHKLPMFKDLVGASKCRGSNSKSEKLSVLKREMDNDPDGTLEPTGFVFHETRCGSTLVADMLAAHPHHLTFSESTPPAQVARPVASERTLSPPPPPSMPPALGACANSNSRPVFQRPHFVCAACNQPCPNRRRARATLRSWRR